MSNKVVLLIEDNIDDERLTLRALGRNNIMNEVVVAGDGEQGLDYLFGRGAYEGRDMEVMPAVVILDLKLPGLSGLDTLKGIRGDERTRKIPVVVLTSGDSEAEVDHCYEAGANSFIRKPVDPSEFSEMVLQLGMYWLLLNRTPAARAAV